MTKYFCNCQSLCYRLLSIAGVIAATIYPPAASALLEIIAVLGVLDAILTLIISGYDIIYQNGDLWDNLLEIIIAILEIIPYLEVPNAKKIKEIVCINVNFFSNRKPLFFCSGTERM